MKLIIFFLLSVNSVLARPVGYKGATNLLSFTRFDRSENTLHYSPEYYYSLGVRSFNSNKLDFNGAYGAYLLKRWNLSEAQANIFSYGGLGVDENNEFTGHYGTQLDYETRKIYLLYNYQAYNGNILLENHISRVGYAPFKAGYNDLNFWFILEYSSLDDNLSPITRFFYKNVLWEIGYNTDQEVIFNIMIQEFF